MTDARTFAGLKASIASARMRRVVTPISTSFRLINCEKSDEKVGIGSVQELLVNSH